MTTPAPEIAAPGPTPESPSASATSTPSAPTGWP